MRSICFILASVLVSLAGSAAVAQECSVLSGAEAKEVANKDAAQCDTQCTGCGCKGGPGYRGADGRCVGYSNLISKCGPKPHDSKGCTRECFVVISECRSKGKPADGEVNGATAASLAPASAATLQNEATRPKGRSREAAELEDGVGTAASAAAAAGTVLRRAGQRR
jgi:hypothetical protein